MFKFSGKGSTSTCDGLSRRDFLQVGTLGAMGFSMAQFNALKAMNVVDKSKDERACIMIFNLGAPSQMDTWDPKPDAPREVRGPYKDIKTKAYCMHITDIFTQMSNNADKISLVRIF
jgi:hypothetical protein